jgi:hypothetical protein
MAFKKCPEPNQTRGTNPQKSETQMINRDTTPPNWQTNRDRINGLWPRFEPTAAERELINARLANLNHEWVRDAIDAYRCASGSTVFRVAEFLDIYRATANASAERHAAQTSYPDRVRDRAVELAADRAACMQRLDATPRDDIARAVVALRYSGWLSNKPLSPRYEDWRDSDIFVVVAGLVSRYNGHRAAAVADTEPTTLGGPKC